MKKIWIISGESSGDIYGANLARELKRIAAANGEELELSGMGGARMIAAGVNVLVDSTELGVMGVFEVSKLLFTFIRIFFKLLKAAKSERPDAVVLIDYPGFNLRFAKALYKAKIPVVWYVSPQVWVWGKKRKPILARVCSKMLVIFPFETEVYADTRLAAEFVGHPLIDLVAARTDPSIKRDGDTVLLLPGSRKMEIERLLPPMLESVAKLGKKHPNLKFHLAAPREKIAAMCRKMLEKFRRRPDMPEVEISTGDTGYWLQRAGSGIASSGTVTVEAAIAGLPLVVGYKLNFFTLFLAWILVKLYRGFFTMTNIIANREVFQEFLQWSFSPKHIVPALEAILPGGSRRAEVEAGMTEVRESLSARSGNAARQAALSCWEVAARRISERS
ncbi:MAG: lipid-A-disaccharide synthase [Lentisphaeria bacterium]|nr:lipid-A-disaccharide synthase [Lentisphaeria bacterium]